MIPTIPPSAYFDEDVFQKEHEKIFQHYWQFIGFRSDLDNHRDYITGNIGKKNIIAQNFNGELKAFHNVCSHRYCRIHQEEKGNRPLKCPYHGWTYNSNGSLVGVPFKSDFSELKGNNWQEHFRLEEWEIDNCGQFVFVKTKKNKVSLKKFLGSYSKILEEMSTSLGKLLYRYQYIGKANWKLAVENSLEYYHLGLVHPSTFSMVGFTDFKYDFEELHSTVSTKVIEKSKKKMKDTEKYFNQRLFKVDGYFHLLLFPNFTISTTYGFSFGIQTFSPISPSEHCFTGYIFDTKLPNTSGSGKAIIESLNKSVVQFNCSVYEEDRRICELNQQGIEECSRTGILGSGEERIFEFQKAYNLLLNKLEE